MPEIMRNIRVPQQFDSITDSVNRLVECFIDVLQTLGLDIEISIENASEDSQVPGWLDVMFRLEGAGAEFVGLLSNLPEIIQAVRDCYLRKPGRYFVPGRIIVASTVPDELAAASSDDIAEHIQELINNIVESSESIADNINVLVDNESIKHTESSLYAFAKLEVTEDENGPASDQTVKQVQEALNDSDGLAASPDVWSYPTSIPDIPAGPAPYYPIGGGGPGGVPVPYIPPCDVFGNILQNQIPYGFSINDSRFQNNGDGNDVVVFIMDTVPSRQVCDDAVANWSSDNPLIADLLGTAAQPRYNFTSVDLNVDPRNPQQLEIIVAETEGSNSVLDADILADKEQRANNPPGINPLNSHGVFIAGIVRSLAPNAKIYLVEVLNDVGVGSLWGWIDACYTVRELLNTGHSFNAAPWDGKEPLPEIPSCVINCSLYFDYRPGDDTSVLFPVFQALWEVFGDQLNPTINQHLRTAVVAASGNDAAQLTGGAPKDARYPAIYDPLFGVAALKSDGTRGEYSNLADYQRGFTVFGGDIIVNASLNQPYVSTDPDTGILGIYLNNFVVDVDAATGTISWEPNSHGWARWAGTSFSTGVMSGLIAGWVSEQDVALYENFNNDRYMRVSRAIESQLLNGPNIVTGSTTEYLVDVEQTT